MPSKNSSSFDFALIQNGRMAAILDFCYNMLHIDHMQYVGAT